jgi:outer membrane lipoprotein carrier protein
MITPRTAPLGGLKKALALAFGVFLTISQGVSAQTTTPLSAQQTTDTVAKVQAFYDKAQTFSSDFTQEYTIKAYNQKKTSAGHLVFAKPGKMDFNYSNPAGNRVVSDGTTLKAYEASNKQMFQTPVDKSQHPAALSFLTGTGKLDQSFDFKAYDGKDMNFPGGIVLMGTPKQANPAYTTVLFYVDNASSQVRRVMIIDGQSNRNRFDFNNPQLNLPIAPNQFQFTPPPGTSVVKPG